MSSRALSATGGGALPSTAFLVGAYLDVASAAVVEMGGKVAKKLGDGLMALFGYPVAQENDAERAVRAALAIQRALAELSRKNEGAGKPPLAARIAIESGPVVVDAAGEIFGDVPNVAARAQALGEPGSVVVTARVQRQVAGLFVAEERGSHELKGVPEPVTLFRLVRASGGGRRAGQRHLTPLVWSRRGDRHADASTGRRPAAPGPSARLAQPRMKFFDQARLTDSRLADATYVGGMELLTAPAKHAAAPDRRMGAAAVRRRRRSGGTAREHADAD